jgi:hypothetical protein
MLWIAIMRRQLFSRTLLQWMFWIGLILCIAGIAMPFAGLRNTGNFVLGTGLATIGLNMLLGGELITGPLPRSFTVRGPVVRGHVMVKAGLSDLLLESGSGDRIASVIFGPAGTPGFEVTEGVAYLRLKNPLLAQNITRWQASLAGNVLWDLDYRSFLGDLKADLENLRFEQINIRTVFGGIDLTSPRRGYTRIELHTVVSPITIHIPLKVGARITVRGGALTVTNVINPRLEIVRRGRYETQGFDSSTGQVEIHIEALAGEVTLME